MTSPMDGTGGGTGLVPLTSVIGLRAAPSLVGVINADVGATAAVAAALLGRLAANHDAKSSMPVAVAERGVVPVVAERLRSRDARVVVAAAASCLALADLAPRLRSALASAGVLRCLLDGIVNASPPLAALYARALWAILRDDEVCRAAEEGALRSQVILGDDVASSLMCILQRSIAAEAKREEDTDGATAAAAAAAGDHDVVYDQFLSDGVWLRLSSQLGVPDGPTATREAVIGLVWRTAPFPENRVSLLRAGAPSALAAVLAGGPSSRCLEVGSSTRSFLFVSLITVKPRLVCFKGCGPLTTTFT